jgi:cytoskeleton protein RodZ
MAKARRKQHQHTEPDHPEEQRSATIVAMPMPTPPDDGDQEPPFERIGDILRRERERRGDDLQQIADHLCIRRSYLNAIENSNYDEFPADIYVIGFLRSYAQYLNLDGQEVVDYYRHEMEGRRKKPALILPVPISEGRTPSAIILVGAAIAALLIYISWYSLSTSDRTGVSAPPALPPAASSDTSALIHGTEKPVVPMSPPPAETENAPTPLPEPVVIPAASPAAAPAAVAQKPAETASPPPAPLAAPTPAPVANMAATSAPESILPQSSTPASADATPATPAPDMNATPAASAPAANTAPTPTIAAAPSVPHIVIKAEQTSWVLIADGKGHPLYDNVMKAGETYVVPDTPGLTLTTGNGAGLVLILDGKNLPKISKSPSSRIIHNIPLNAAALKNLPSMRY